ncbi:MAG: ketol-acid reductoisomerase [Anaerolineae bacterium]|nr:ketol-acid reductoisomerase [Anaerolineae bacterium]
MPVIYSEADADLAVLEGQRLCIIGYREMGRAIALNLRDSGFAPVVGEEDERRAEQARADSFEVQSPGDAARDAALKILAEPDEALPDTYHQHISPGLRRDDTLVFTSGYTIAFGFIEPPPFVDAVMISPRTLGADLRDAYLHQTGLLSFVSVGQDSSGEAWPRLLALAKAIGALRGGAMELSFQQQAELDLFAEQALLSAVHHVLAVAADLLVSEGYPPEAAIMSLYVSGELGDALSQAARIGMMGLLARYSLTRQYGVLSRLDRYQDTKLRRVMETALEEIRSGRFAQEWTNEYHNGYPRLDTLRTRRTTMSLWKLERQAIQLMDQIAPRPEEE